MRLRKKLAIWFYAFFIQAGYFKSDPRLSWLPIDLTALMAFLVIGFLLVEILKSPRISKRILWLLLFFVSFLPGLIDFDITPYVRTKVIRFYSQTLLVAIGPFFFIRTREELREFLKATVAIGLFLAFDVLFQLVITKGNVWKITAFGSSVIAIGRSVGLVSVYFGIGYAMERSLLNIVLLLGSALVLLVSGQRMAMVGPVFAIVFTLLSVYGVRVIHLKRLVAIGLLIIVIISATYFALPERTRHRIERFFGGGLSGFVSSGNVGRKVAFINSLDQSVDHPFGLGLGGFQNKVEGLGDYPHNIVAETFVEGGWLAGILLVILGVVSFFSTYFMARDDPIYLQFLGLFLFAFFYALVAGDLNDNRMLFSFIGSALAISKENRGRQLEQVDW